MTTRAALYVRVSTPGQVEDGFSIPEQRRELLAHAEAQGWVVADVIVDEGHSGAVGVRPGLDRVMELAEAGAIDVVLAKKRNRLFRDRYIRMGYERALLEHGVKLLALDDAGHRFADAVMDEFGDYFREEVRLNTIAGKMQKAREGKIVGANAPIFGFRFVKDERRKAVGFEVDEARMAVVRKVIETVAATGTVNATKRILERENVPTTRGTPVWREVTIRRMVFNDAYRPRPFAEIAPLLTAEAKARFDPDGEYGVVWYPKLKTTRLDPDPARNYARPQRTTPYGREEQVPIPVVSSGIPAETIDAARLALRDNVAARNTGDRVYQLAGLIRCADCGNRLATNRKVDGPRTYHYYRCSNCQRHGPQVCSMNKNYPADALERMVLTAVLDAVKDRDELIRKANDTFEREKRRLLRAGGSDVAALRRERDGLEDQRMAYFRQSARGRLDDERLDALVSEVDRQQHHLDGLVGEYEGRERRLRDLQAARDKAVDQIKRGEWAKLGITDPEQRRERYREIGLSATAAVDGTVRLSWGLGEKTMLRTGDHTPP